MSESPNARALARALSRWFEIHARELPWRETRDPYRVWVSEIMLQQTRVETVLAYYTPFVERFPSVESLACAAQDDVLEQWSGLGYYRRARLLHRGAQYVAQQLGGRLPAQIEGLRKIPGIGPYTAGALASIAFDKPEPLVDGNVARVSTRLRAVEDPAQQGASAKAHWSFVREIVQAGEPRVLAQALMELGATVCKPKNPACDECPVRRHCAAAAAGIQLEIPAPKLKKQSPEFHFDVLGILWGRRLLLERRPDEGLLAGMWCLPLVSRKGEAARAPSALKRRLPRALKLDPSSLEPAAGARIKHVFTHRVWHLQPWILRMRKQPKRPNAKDYAWIEAGERPAGGVPSVTNKVLARLGY